MFIIYDIFHALKRLAMALITYFVLWIRIEFFHNVLSSCITVLSMIELLQISQYLLVITKD